MSSNEAETVARALLAAHEFGQMIEPPSAHSAFNLDAAYAVEADLRHARESAGHPSVGRKVGYANKAMWRVLKLETLVWAHMYEDTVHYAQNNSGALPIANPRSLKIEPEIVFGLKAPITEPGLDAAAALAATAWIALGFEIIDCPYPEWKFQPSDFVASFGLHAALIVGDKMNVTSEAIPRLAEDLAKFKLSMIRIETGRVIEEGSGKNSLKNPALCLAELGAAIARRFPDEPLSAGEIVSSGTLTAGHATAKGDRWRAEVEGISLPALTLEIA